MTRFLPTLSLIFVLGAGIQAANPKFVFKQGDSMQYRIEQKTEITETILDEKTSKPDSRKMLSSLELVRQWKVIDVDAKGTGTLEMSIVKMRWEQKTGTNEPDIFDSSKPDELNKKEMAKNVGPVLAVLTVDSNGKVLSVKDSKVGPAHRFQSDVPFKLVFPEAEIKESWSREFTLQLDPPLGTGEKFASKQSYKLLEPKNGLSIYSLTSEIGDLPKNASEQIPLIPSMPSGMLFFHPETGRYYGARLKIEKELSNHQGEGSSYKFSSTYVEDFIPAK